MTGSFSDALAYCGKLMENGMDDPDVQKTLELSDDLRKAALNLMKHLRVNHFRIRVDGTSPELYITLGEGRHAHDAEMKHFRVKQESYIAAGLKSWA